MIGNGKQNTYGIQSVTCLCLWRERKRGRYTFLLIYRYLLITGIEDFTIVSRNWALELTPDDPRSLVQYYKLWTGGRSMRNNAIDDWVDFSWWHWHPLMLWTRRPTRAYSARPRSNPLGDGRGAQLSILTSWRPRDRYSIVLYFYF